MIDEAYDFDVPVPPSGSGRKPGLFYSQIKNMPRGSSIFFAGARSGQINGSHGQLKKRGDVTFRIATRKVVENGVAGIRVWRLDAE